MAVRLQRRSLLTRVMAAGLLRPHSLRAGSSAKSALPMLDLHVHLFGTGDSGSGCRLSNAITKSWQFQLLSARFRDRGRTIDEGYLASLVTELKASGLTKGLIIGQDAVYDAAGKKLAENDDWVDSSSVIFPVATRVGAFPIDARSKDAALLVTLAPGAYTAQVSGVNGGIGIGLVELYEVP